MRSGGLTDIMKLVVAFRKFAKSPKTRATQSFMMLFTFWYKILLSFLLPDMSMKSCEIRRKGYFISLRVPIFKSLQMKKRRGFRFWPAACSELARPGLWAPVFNFIMGIRCTRGVQICVTACRSWRPWTFTLCTNSCLNYLNQWRWWYEAIKSCFQTPRRCLFWFFIIMNLNNRLLFLYVYAVSQSTNGPIFSCVAVTTTDHNLCLCRKSNPNSLYWATPAQ